MTNEIKIGGMNYTVENVDYIEVEGDRNYQGLCNFNDLTIKIIENLNPQRKLEVFIHELLHAMIHEANLEIENEEEVVTVLARYLVQVLEQIKEKNK